MRTRTLSAIASVAILAAASSANAAAIDIVVSQIPGTTDWALQLSFSAFLKVGSLSVETSPNLTSFTINPAIPEISPFGDLSVFALGLLPDGNGVLSLVSRDPLGVIAEGPGITQLGIFGSKTKQASKIQILPGEANLGVTLTDPNGNPYAPSDFSIRVVPGPFVLWLSGAACALVLRARAKSPGR